MLFRQVWEGFDFEIVHDFFALALFAALSVCLLKGEGVLESCYVVSVSHNSSWQQLFGVSLKLFCRHHLRH